MKFKLKDVQVQSGFRLHLRYEDGVEGDVDLSDIAGRGVFKTWDDRAVFENVRITSGGGLEWPGSIDLCEDALYLRITGKSAKDVFSVVKGSRVNA
jgi:hypothetical protein